ncbi:thiamine pyrophosphate-dependent dehydrogenase E1 component subunit alpha [Chloroflexota bacterium]
MTSVQDKSKTTLTKDQLAEMYHRMVSIRIFEENLPDLYDKGLIPGTAHLSLGEEAVAVGVISALGPDDFVVSTHRAHGHALARGASMPIILAEVCCRATGCTGGKGGSMHIHDFDRYFFGTCGIVGGGITVAGGLGLGAKLQKTGQVCVGFFGNGASNRGTFHESLNLAGLLKVPTIFVCINNQYAMTLPIAEDCANPDIASRAASYNMPGYDVDGTDLLAVYETAKKAVDMARRGEGPSLIVSQTYRLSPEHSCRRMGSPETAYRPEGEVDEWCEKYDPIEINRKKLIDMKYLDENTAIKIESDAKKEFEVALDFAMKSPEPTTQSAFEGIYAPEGGN